MLYYLLKHIINKENIVYDVPRKDANVINMTNVYLFKMSRSFEMIFFFLWNTTW